MAHKWAHWLHDACLLELMSKGQNQWWPTSGQVGYTTRATQAPPTLQSKGQNRQWPVSGQIGNLTHAVPGVPIASGRETKQAMAHMWVD